MSSCQGPQPTGSSDIHVTIKRNREPLKGNTTRCFSFPFPHTECLDTDKDTREWLHTTPGTCSVTNLSNYVGLRHEGFWLLSQQGPVSCKPADQGLNYWLLTEILNLCVRDGQGMGEGVGGGKEEDELESRRKRRAEGGDWASN